ncbi:MAG: hypothetical protein LBG28_10800 [Tannerella sp.]|nr:hypothetical protein [Tannerella sp.]
MNTLRQAVNLCSMLLVSALILHSCRPQDGVNDFETLRTQFPGVSCPKGLATFSALRKPSQRSLATFFRL